ncbi:rhodanese-like domain-containing protein [Halococcus saccharolyticus]|uniref:Rhodanese domain-containing protein n=1 Tax=Halococcus saccharolyticus DSM 5350 TaxID=1227455 RepID=M0MKX0_9EURY|nr:rhodanese-like domain-containing protein [Halococcus saccharolyticus]EMA45389.1 rhodanese domain-containing protein [Halococcus saccharolyticus DSM 5350]
MYDESQQASEELQLTKGYEELVAEAAAEVTTLPIETAIDRLDHEVVFVDVRDGPELDAKGRVPGAIHASRGMLEFHIDPESPYHIEEFASGSEFLFYCAVGGRSALAVQTAQEMGLSAVANVEGGFEAWTEAGGPTEMAA